MEMWKAMEGRVALTMNNVWRRCTEHDWLELKEAEEHAMWSARIV